MPGSSEITLGCCGIGMAGSFPHRRACAPARKRQPTWPSLIHTPRQQSGPLGQPGPRGAHTGGLGMSGSRAPAAGTRRGALGSGRTHLLGPEPSLLYGKGQALARVQGGPIKHKAWGGGPLSVQCWADFSRVYCNGDTAGIRAEPQGPSPVVPARVSSPSLLNQSGGHTEAMWRPGRVVKSLDCVATGWVRVSALPHVAATHPCFSPQSGDDHGAWSRASLLVVTRINSSALHPACGTG